jgi:hypothetical protein
VIHFNNHIWWWDRAGKPDLVVQIYSIDWIGKQRGRGVGNSFFFLSSTSGLELKTDHKEREVKVKSDRAG